MNSKQVQKFALRYLEQTGCHIIEKHPAYVTVKLSPEADKRLTNRSYYWSFVERTGAPPETMSFTFVFDPDKLKAETEASASSQGANAGAAPNVLGPSGAPLAQGNADSILGRYFGTSSAPNAGSYGPGRIPREEVTFGSRRLMQLFDAARSSGKYVQLFEEPDGLSRGAVPVAGSSGYNSYLALNVKIELACDMKRDELHSLAVDLSTGELLESFQDKVSGKKLSPRLPPNVYIPRPAITVAKARAIVEQHVERMLKRGDHGWAAKAHERLRDELERVDGYYEDAVKGLDDEAKRQAEEQWNKRREELDWQFRPRIRVLVVNGGLFHLKRPFTGTN
ncbi:YqhG family protein [Paenibacillus sp. GYB003]|uniref:YqhG family protein n=1 Tax=Paenibacillus sp. GYB003 TaxID=2994392 RepID=UPI002F96B677